MSESTNEGTEGCWSRRMSRRHVGSWAFWLEPASLTVAQHELSLDWPGDRSLRVAVLTDLHVGSPFNGMAKLHSTVDRTNAAQPDLICILGDPDRRPGGCRRRWRASAPADTQSRCLPRRPGPSVTDLGRPYAWRPSALAGRRGVDRPLEIRPTLRRWSRRRGRPPSFCGHRPWNKYSSGAFPGASRGDSSHADAREALVYACRAVL